MVKILILGHGEHGKDTAADIITEYTGLRFESSSLAAAEIAVWPHMPEYATAQACFDDRRNHRERWRQLITDYNTPNKARLCREIVSRCDGYVGMRCPYEYAASRNIFDYVLWISAFNRKPADPTMGIPLGKLMHVINNDECVDRLRLVIQRWCKGLGLC